jgi:hypothetical protein
MPIAFFMNVALIFIRSGGSAVLLASAAIACLLVLGGIIQVRRRAFEKRMASTLASAVRSSVMLDREGKAAVRS